MTRSLRLLGVAVSNIARSRRHFALASIGIVVGIGTFSFFMALGLGVRQIVLGKIFPLDQLEVVPRRLDLDAGPIAAGSDVIDDAKVARIGDIEGVEAVFPKMRLTVPSIAWGGQAIVGSNLRTELVADGIDPALVSTDIEAFHDYDADAESTSRPCDWDRECGEGRYCGTPAGTRLPADPVQRRDRVSTIPRVCRDYVPVLASHHVVEIYNGAIRRAHHFPRLDPNMVIGFTFDMTIGASMVSRSNKAEVMVEKGRLVGFSDKAITLGITLPISYVKRYNVAFGAEADAHRYHSAVVSVPEKDDVAHVAQAIGELGLEVADSGAEQAALLIAIFMAVFGLISAVIIAIAAINIMHVFFMVVYERSHEIGIMRAVGASRVDIARIILGEATVLGAAAGVVGTVLAQVSAAICDGVSSGYIPDFPYKPQTYFDFPWWLVAGAISFSVVFCILGALLPARRAARMEPARILSGH